MSWSALPNNACPSRGEVQDAIQHSSGPPNGPNDVFLETQELIPEPGDPVEASWTNVTGSAGFNVVISFEVNEVEDDGQELSPGSTNATFQTGHLSSGDEVRARVHYRVDSDALMGSGVEAGDQLENGAYYNTRLVLTSNLPTDNWPTAGEIDQRTQRNGAFGSYSNTITFS